MHNAGISDRNSAILASESAGCATIGILIHMFLGFFNTLEISEEIWVESPACNFSLLADPDHFKPQALAKCTDLTAACNES